MLLAVSVSATAVLPWCALLLIFMGHVTANSDQLGLPAMDATKLSIGLSCSSEEP